MISCADYCATLSINIDDKLISAGFAPLRGLAAP